MLNQPVSPSLTERIASFRAAMSKQLPPQVASTLEEELRRAAAQEAGASAPRVGDLAPNFTLPDLNGHPRALADLAQRGPVVLTFYRGGWCPFCDLQLRAYQEMVPELAKLEARVVAVSPEVQEKGRATAAEKQLGFALLTDANNQVAQRYGLSQPVTAAMQGLLGGMGVSLPDWNGTPSPALPIPGTFVIGRDLRVALAFVDPDYRKRLEPGEILRACRALRTM